MKNLSKLVRSSPNYTGDWSAIGAAEEFNGLILALASSNPYHKFTGGLSARCIHCGGKFDPTADSLDAKKHHEESCLWLASWELAELCKQT